MGNKINIEANDALDLFETKIMDKLLSKIAYDTIAKKSTSTTTRLTSPKTHFTNMASCLSCKPQAHVPTRAFEPNTESNRSSYSRCCVNLYYMIRTYVFDSLYGAYIPSSLCNIRPLFTALLKESLSKYSEKCVTPNKACNPLMSLRITEILECRKYVKISTSDGHPRIYLPKNVKPIYYTTPDTHERYEDAAAMAVGIYHEFVLRKLNTDQEKRDRHDLLHAMCDTYRYKYNTGSLFKETICLE